MNDQRVLQATIDMAEVGLRATIAQSVYLAAIMLHVDAPVNTPFRRSVRQARELLREFENTTGDEA